MLEAVAILALLASLAAVVKAWLDGRRLSRYLKLYGQPPENTCTDPDGTEAGGGRDGQQTEEKAAPRTDGGR